MTASTQAETTTWSFPFSQAEWDQTPWSVAEAVRDQIRSERGRTEGVIGTLKSNRYKFNKPKERLWQTLEMAGPRSILSFNLNKFMRDLVALTR